MMIIRNFVLEFHPFYTEDEVDALTYDELWATIRCMALKATT